jgi:REP element-mobilizing transposase RayT
MGVAASQIAEIGALGYNAGMHKHLRRLGRIWIDAPIYFVTSCTQYRRKLLVCDNVANILIAEWRAAHDRHGWAVGRYVIMPDHVHFFCRSELDAKTLSEFAGNWKSWTSRTIRTLGVSRSAPATTTLWQREFFDHVLRSSESYSEKWNYVRDNPVRAGLVSTADEWKYAGEIEILML